MTFQGLTPLATDPGSSGAGTRNAQNGRNTQNDHNTQNDRNTGSTGNTGNVR